MSRGTGLAEWLAGAPDAAVFPFGLLTQLGDAWFLFSLFGLLYLAAPPVAADPRRAGATLVAVAVAALGLTVALKTAFALPRPPGAATATAPAWLPGAGRAAYVDAVTGDGFGFPSGHAVGATAGYGAAAWLLDRLDRRRRLLAAVAVVAVVDLSRLVLGVHYLVDVAVGSAVALALLGAVRAVDGRRRPARAFALAAAVGAAALLAVGVRGGDAHLAELAPALGGAVGGLFGWRYTAARNATEPLPPALSVAGLAAAGGAWGAVYALEPPLALGVAVDAAGLWLLLALPGLAAAWRAR
jgi:membrane-associated phospholipid phosphatase